MRLIDRLLNSITMYRLLVYGLGGLAGLGILFALVGKLSFSPTAMLASLGLLLLSAFCSDWVYSRIWKVPSNNESWLITALILFLILPAPKTISEAAAIVLAASISSVSKYVVTWHGKHIFNPAALAAAFLGFTSLLTTTWWIGSTIFWPFTLLFGLAVVRKIRRYSLVLTFVVITLAVQLALLVWHQRDVSSGLQHALLTSPLIFLASIMLTEPATMPPRRAQQIIFAAGIAVLYVTAWKIGPVYIYPEVALLLGNIYAFVVSPKLRVRLELQEIQRISDRVYNYVFRPDKPFRFLPGQYMEWTLAGVPYDSRGNRRTFTLASSPTENEVQLGLKFYEPASTYKSVMARMRPGDVVYGSHLAGNFTFEPDAQQKLAFIAGGIGITPFRSMIKYIIDTNRSCDIVLLYMVGDENELAYVREFQQAAAHGLKFVPILTSGYTSERGLLSATLSEALLRQQIPDFAERQFYISGPNIMVDEAKKFLKKLHVPRNRIKTDHFSGY